MATATDATIPDAPQRGPVRGPARTMCAIQTIAVPFDSPAGARAALAPARALAARLDAELVLMGVERGQAYDSVVRDSLAGEVAQARAAGLRARGVVLAEPATSAEWPAQLIAAAAQDVRADMVVQSFPTWAPGAEDALDGVMDTTVAAARIPVLLTPPYLVARARGGALSWLGWDHVVLAATRSGTLGAPITALKLLVALDGTPDTEAALPHLANLAISLHAHVSLVRVAPRTLYSGRDLVMVSLIGAAARLQEMGVTPERVRVTARVGPVADTLLDQAAREATSILVLASHVRRGVARATPGSVTAEVIRRAPLPVLLIGGSGA